MPLLIALKQELCSGRSLLILLVVLFFVFFSQGRLEDISMST